MALLCAVALGGCAAKGADEGSPDGAGAGSADPGRVTAHRLNRVEYDNTIRDLLGTAQRPAEEFPSDDRGYGFDNIADVLTLSPLQVEMYLRAAEKLVAEAIAAPVAQPFAGRWEGEEATGPKEAPVAGRPRATVGGGAAIGWNLWSNGELEVDVKLPADGTYRLTVGAFSKPAGPEPARLAILVDGKAQQTFDVTAPGPAPGTHAVEAKLAAGAHVVAASFLNDYYMPPEDRNLMIDWLAVDGPLDCKPTPNPPRSDHGLRSEGHGGRPLRLGDPPPLRPPRLPPPPEPRGGRPPRRSGPRRHRGGESFDQGIEAALIAILVSHHLLFRVEIDPDPAAATPHPLSPHELAARLSYRCGSDPDAVFPTSAVLRILMAAGRRPPPPAPSNRSRQ